MENQYNNYSVTLETLISIFTIDKGDLKILLMRKKTEPFKGYWILPGNILSSDVTLEENITNTVTEELGLSNLSIEQCFCVSEVDRMLDKRVIATSYLGLIDSVSVELKLNTLESVEVSWFKINAIPKIAYDHEEIIKRTVEYLKTKIVNSNVLKNLFPSDFTLPEIQKVYEQILNRTLDRRNFRKKFINLDLIEDTGYKNEGFNGRPAKLYRFKENLKERNLF